MKTRKIVVAITLFFSLIIFIIIFCVRANSVKLTGAEADELMAIIHVINRPSMPYKAIVKQQMLIEANYAIERLKLPAPHPIQIADVCYSRVADAWYSLIRENDSSHFPDTIYGRDLCNTNIARDQRIRALKIGVCGTFETTNFCFRFYLGKLTDIERISEHGAERYSRNLDELVGKPSFIDTNGAYQLATQWLAVMDVDMPALRQLKWTVNQLHYKPSEATNFVMLPLFYVDFGNKHTPAQYNLPAADEPLVSVEILGTTKELQEILIRDSSLSRRPPMLITNILELVHTPDSKMKHLEQSSMMTTNLP